MKKILNIVGARPQIIKVSAISRAMRSKYFDAFDNIIVHTGQHYDWKMSEVFFNELEIPCPKYNLGAGSASHGVQTANMITGIENVILKEKPDFVLVYGDTNSTLAAAIAASKLHCPIIHIEAGLRSFNKKMPEEINRIICDHVSTLLFPPTETGIKNLLAEGFRHNIPPFHMDNPGIFNCGDVMYDNSLYFSNIAEQKSTILKDCKTDPDNYLLLTLHRDTNTDNISRLQSIFNAVTEICSTDHIHAVIPLHPRTLKAIGNLPEDLMNTIKNHPQLKIIPPVSFFDMVVLEKNARIILTDSGGVQKESFFFKKPCVILRDQTEWTEIVDCGTAILAGADTERIIKSYAQLIRSELDYPSVFGNGKAAELICEIIQNQ